jgi:uncharacterized protein (DUF433 family)
MAVPRSSIDEHIVRNPRVLGGEPIVRGTRISVRSIVLAAREYGAPDGVLQAYPQLGLADIRDALAFYEVHADEIDRYISRNLDED